MTTQRISKTSAADSAAATMVSFLQLEAGDPLFRPWSLANIQLPEAGPSALSNAFDNPIELFDLRGRILFRDFNLQLKDGNEMRIRTTASRAMGPPVWSIGVNPPFNLNGRVKAAIRKARRQKLDPREDKKALVMYSYPKIGILCRRADGSEVVFDIGDLETVDLETDGERSLSPDLLGYWSPLDALTSTANPRLEESFNNALSALPNLSQIGPDPNSLSRLIEGSRARTEQTVLPDCANVRARQCMRLHGQETQVYCAVATAQMILEWHGFRKTQDQIAVAMQTGASGTSNPNQVEGYRILTDNVFNATFDDTASFFEAKRQIEEGRPLKSGVPSHARACAGWKIEHTAEGQSTKWLWIYDPWPPNEGAKYFESWTEVVHTNYIYVKRRLIS